VSYSIERANLIADQLERLATQNTHQLAGQVANLDFWISETVAAISIIDNYRVLAESEREKCKKGPLALASERRAA